MSKIWGFPLTLIVALTTVLRITVLHCDVRLAYVLSLVTILLIIQCGKPGIHLLRKFFGTLASSSPKVRYTRRNVNVKEGSHY